MLKNNPIFIAHRGNTNGPNPEQENNPEYINKAISLGYHAEIDVWKIGDKLFLGHDEPQYEIELSYLKNPKFWCHAKNKEALHFLLQKNIHCFWHQSDDYTITSKGYVWCYPGKPTPPGSVCVMPEWNKGDKGDEGDDENKNPIKINNHCYAYCSDYKNF